MLRLLLILALTSPLFGALLAGGANIPLPAGAALRPLSDNIAIRPSSKTVNGGESFILDVQIEGSDPVVATDVWITFDTAYLEVTSVTSSGVFKQFLIAPQTNLAAGLIFVSGLSDIGGTPPPIPPFTFFTLAVRAKSVPGTTALVFDPAETDVQGVNGSVRGSLINGSVEIRPAPAAVSNLSASRADDTLVLNWSDVNSDVNGSPLIVDHYVVYWQASSPYFSPAAEDIIAAHVTGLTFTDNDNTPWLGAGTSAFYAVQAVGSDNQASATPNRLGVFNFGLQAGSVGLSSQNGRPIPTRLLLFR